jgi:enamine deaminase RidA (YjgF/YER057c/UK114 family)
MQNLAHSASFESLDKDAPSKAGTKHLAYVPVTLHDGVAYVSGQLPKIDGEVRVFGKLGREVTLDAARK